MLAVGLDQPLGPSSSKSEAHLVCLLALGRRGANSLLSVIIDRRAYVVTGVDGISLRFSLVAGYRN